MTIQPRSILIILMLLCFQFLPKVDAVSPPPDGGYSGGNTAEGQNALLSLTTGMYNTAIGLFSLLGNTEANFNTGIGAGALLVNATAGSNTAIGAGALFSHTTGNSNTATGTFALFSDTNGQANTATGANALFSNTTGNFNVADGYHALFSNTTGSFNTANGEQALNDNTTGSENTASGLGALGNNTTGSSNAAIGRFALVGNTTGSNNIAVGTLAGSELTTGDANIDIGNQGVAGESQTIRIGTAVHAKTFIAAIRGRTTGNNDALPVLIDSAGQLGTINSSRRFKKEITPMNKASEAILALKPVTFHYKNDETNRPEFGLIAEDVAQVNPDLVVRDENGEIYTVRYDAVNAMLLNEFLKEHCKVQEFETTVAQQQESFQAKLTEQEKRIEALTSDLQKLSAQVGRTQPEQQVAANNP